MSLSTAFNVISSSFAVNSAQSAVVSNNIANANTPGYSREIANVATNSYGGAEVASITREANAALLEQVLSSASQAAAQQAISDGLTTLAATVDDSSSASSTSGANQNGASPSAMLANLQGALSTYEDSPTSASAAEAVVLAASDLVSSLNSGSATVAQVREQADQNMTTSVSTINSLLSQFTAANNAVVTGLQTGANIASAEDTRDSIVTQLSQQIGVSTVTAANGSESIYTDSGVTLFQTIPRAVSFTPTATLVDGANGAPVTVDGVPITGASSPMPIQSGALAGYAALRDTLAPEYEAQLDQIAGGLINAFAESDQSATPTLPSLPGLFTTPGATGLPSMSATTGLAAAIEVNPNVDPSQGGNRNLLRDGGISDPGNPAYTYNTSGSASYTGRVQELAGDIGANRSFDPSAGLGSSSSLADYANASVSWLQGQNQQASDSSSYQSALATQATSALSNATGVNLDAEMTNMLNLENS
ncbi:MAG TPA: flagellar hook-associated protein FlgK, partial [Roseiarcus sp.]